MIWDILLDALIDTAKSIPFLFLAYLLMEFIEHKASEKMENALKKIGAAGPAVGAGLGCIPQCGFSASAANLYTAGVITEGTLISVFISTSDEAVPILLSSPESYGAVWKLILFKLLIGILSGFAIDIAFRLMKIKKQPIEMCSRCGCEEESGIFKPALRHTLKISVFILAVNIVLGLLIGLLGEERLSAILLSGSFAQPFITALVGLIPNCAVSVMLTQLYVGGSISFGAAMAGLCSGAGIGLAVLLKSNTCKKENVRIVITLYLISALAGVIIMLTGIK